MSVTMKVIEFEQREAHLSSELDGGAPYTVHGIALGADDITRGASGIKKLWPAEELQAAAETLEGTNLVEDHENESRGVVGEVTKAGYEKGVGVLYEAELYDDELAEKISNGLLEVSVRGFHKDVDEMELDDETGAKIVEDIEFDNLSVVASGASPSNTLEIGAHDELSAAELSAYVETLDYEAALQEDEEIEPGMWVKWDGGNGVTISTEEDGEFEVDIYEEQDGQWRSIEETTMVSTDDLSAWDVDEDDIGAVADEEEEDEGEDEEDEDSEEATSELAEDGDTVKWDSSGGMAQGVVRDTKSDGCFNDEIDGDVEVCADDEEDAILIEIVEDGEPTGEMVAHKEGTLSDADFEMAKHKMDPEMEDDKETEQVDPPEFEEGMMVQWSVNPNMFGEVVHNPDNENIIMVEVMEMMDGEMKPTGHTLTAAPPDLEPMDNDSLVAAEELESFSDYPEAAKENAQMALDAREETDNPNDCGTDVGWKRANQLASGEAVSEDVVAKMSAFNRHRQNSDMDDEEGKADCGWMMWKAWGGDEGVDWARRKQKEIDEMSAPPVPERDEDTSVEELQDIEVHDVSFDGTTDSEWSKPNMEDFDTDDLGEIADHFVVSKTGFPPENYTDLSLPVVEPNGELNLNALQNAKARGGQVEGLSGDDLDRAMSIITTLANENFDANFEEAGHRPEGAEFDGEQGKENQPWRYPGVDGDTEDDEPEDSGVHEDLEEAGVTMKDSPTDSAEPTHKMDPSVEDDREMEQTDPIEVALDCINLFLRQNGKNERDSVDKMLGWLFSSTDVPTAKIEGFRVAANAFLDAQGGADSFDAVDVEAFRDWLLTQGGQTDDGVHARPTNPTIATPVHVLSGDDLTAETMLRASKKDDSTTEDNITMTNIEEELSELDEPVAVEKEDFEELQEKADRMDEMSETLASLQERTDVLDSVDREQVEELAESDDPVVLESSEYEELSAEAEQVKGVYAEALSDESPFSADDLVDKFSIEELREKYEEAGHELEDELEADPRSGDVEEEELEERAEEEQQSQEELEQEEAIESKQDELREKILSGD